MKPKIIQHIKLFVPIALGLAFAMLAWIRLVVQNSDLLYEAQEQSFWQSGHLFRAEMLEQAGGWFTYLGRYLTQFFYYPALGASMLIAIWLVIYLLTCAAFRLKWYLSWIALVIPMLLLWAETSLGYAIYTSKVPDWWFTPTLFAVFIALLLVVARPWNIWARSAWQTVVMTSAIFLAHQWQNETQMPASMFVPFHAAQEDSRFHAELRMDRAIEEGNWHKALNEMRTCKEAPTRTMWMLKTVALLHEGRLANSWLDYPCMTQTPNFSDSIVAPIVTASGPLIYFHHGSIQFAYRWSIENMVEYGVSNKRLRLMVRCALLKEEWDLAEKYLNLLSRTTFYRDWAENQRRFIHHPELLAEDDYYRTPLAISKSLPNLLDGDQSLIENYIVNTYSQMSIHKCPELSELNIVYAMQSQNITRFWTQFFTFANLLNERNMPLRVQEAAYLFIQLEPQSAPRTDFPFDPAVPESFKNFNARSQQLMQVGYRDDGLARAMQKEFGKTYYWFYFFCRHQNTY